VGFFFFLKDGKDLFFDNTVQRSVKKTKS